MRTSSILNASVGVVIASLVTPLGGCGDSTMRMDGNMRLETDMKAEGTMRIEGPIQLEMNLHGPSVRYTGVYISEELFERVEVGKTRQDWLIAVLGEPTGKATLDDGSDIWKWTYRPEEVQGSVVTVLSTGGKDEPSVVQSTSFVQMRDGVVIDKWRD